MAYKVHTVLQLLYSAVRAEGEGGLLDGTYWVRAL